MSESSMDPAATAGAETGGGDAGPVSPLARAAGVFYAPVATFRSLGQRFTWADWAVPLLLGLVLSVGAFLLVLPHLDIITGARESLEAWGLSSEEVEKNLANLEENASGAVRYRIMATQGVGYLVFLALLALIFWGGASAFGGYITYARTLAVVSYAWLVRILEATLLYVVVQGREPVRADRLPSVLATNPASYLSMDQADTVLYAVMSSLNLFTLWVMGLIALGLSEVGRMSRGAAFGLVGLLFGVWLALVAGWAAIF